ncbi:MAG: hypothetical protein A2428_09105 [Bdellovibrionales bacterium RIFOXYC1_FULL_54_43]|nr:MAG: hypothetical protein A2428_09105 [Bdellovibrionales bacterium RIFOXYC1_FULL_54_43]OFZ83578.1 MAG: hypothetical protein A2603_00390 [Bdellovibrionales bacterium RIFOXYD1_FULL_55_31]HLE01519.1 hypothetical protein [Bdellovibrionota bacterium]
MSQLLRDENGQALVEYILMLSLAVMLVSIMAVGFRKLLFKLWEHMTQATVGPSPIQPHNNVKYRF